LHRAGVSGQIGSLSSPLEARFIPFAEEQPMPSKHAHFASHPFLRIGKAPAKRDRRNIQLGYLLKVETQPRLPKQWDFDADVAISPIPTPMFANDRVGNCLIASRAHMTLRFEYFEQGRVLDIPDTVVIREYHRERNRLASEKKGLHMLDSLKAWRKLGWTIDRKKYRIFAFAEIDRKNVEEIKTAIHRLHGVYAGLALPNAAYEQIMRGQRWDLVPGPNGKPNPKNGHCVYLCGYTKAGPVCVTWGRKQAMTWDFFTACSDEAYAIVDARDPFLKNSLVDIQQLKGMLAKL
jgi:hypothetical protein